MRRRGYLYFEDEAGRRAAAIRVWMTQGWFRMTPAVRLGGMGFPEQRLTSGLPKPTTAPCGSLTQLAARLGTSAGTQLRFFQCTRWRSKRGNLGFPDDPQACRRGIAPKNIATFNTRTEALEPHGRYSLDQLRCVVPSHMGGGNEKALPSRRQTG
jgi:hypothetical protein